MWFTGDVGTGRLALQLRQAKVPFVDRNYCSHQYEQGMIDASMICAGGNSGSAACFVRCPSSPPYLLMLIPLPFYCALMCRTSFKGDSGGPLVVKRGSKWYQYGIVSTGPRTCTGKGAPGKVTVTHQLMQMIVVRQPPSPPPIIRSFYQRLHCYRGVCKSGFVLRLYNEDDRTIAHVLVK